jgi:RsiW-degrading membrane proteinase PrsW (M82 family)
MVDSDYLTCDKCGPKARNLVFGEFDALCHTCELKRNLFWLFWRVVGFVVISAFYLSFFDARDRGFGIALAAVIVTGDLIKDILAWCGKAWRGEL